MHIGIDLGGTNIAAAFVEKDGTITKRASLPANAAQGTYAVIRGLSNVCEVLLGDADPGVVPTSIGIGVPGTVNDEAGKVVFTPNLPLLDVDVTGNLKKKFGCPVALGNDANCAALGETVAGGSRGAQDVTFVTLGTGIGGGIILNGHLHTGLSGAASELGHMVIVAGGRQCGCGRRGCWERYASASGLIKTAVEFMATDKRSMLWDICGGTAEQIDGKAIFDAFRAGDQTAKLTVERYIEHLAAGVVNIINILEPEMICLGGGIANAWDCLAEPLEALADSEKFFRFSTSAPKTKIVKAQLGNDAGIIGAAMLGLSK
ncbi:MAG: ROK family protein [Oscillospiraceae bacterium]|nr:ROK family protein [Oscillospiraceae bacterium]